MTDPKRPLVSGDTAESRTRETYTTWMRRGLEVAESLAAEHPGRPAWPPADPSAPDSGRRSPWTVDPPAPTDTTVEAARQAGWLVSAGTADGPGTPAGALAGLAVAVKDIIDVAGLPVRNGTPGALWREPTESAVAWARLAAAGASCVGKAATAEMAWGVTTPQIPHPHDPERIAGGSSGGSAACVAARVSQGALGTDTGGSIRIPAALCGVVGFRPTTGSIDMSGITPLAAEQDVAGPFAADVRTCTAMLEVLLDRPLGPGTADVQRVTGVRIGVLDRVGRLDATVEEAYGSVLGVLEDSGAEIVPVTAPIARQAASISLLAMLASSAVAHSATVHRDPEGFGSEARALLTIGDELRGQAGLIESARGVLRSRTAELFTAERLDLLLTPATACTAPPRGAETIDIAGKPEPVSAALTRFAAWASVTAMPAVSVPVPGRGLPSGVQIMAPPHREDLCARMAALIEHRTRNNA